MNTITDDQIAEIEAAVSFPQTRSYTDVENGTVLALITRLREAERDAARYRWLKDQDHFRAMSMDMGGNHTWVGMGRCVGRGDTVDAAIDAAMQAAREAAE